MTKNLFLALGLMAFFSYATNTQSIINNNQKTGMIRSEQQVTKQVNVSASAIWDVLKTGDDVDKWLPHIIKSCKLEGNMRYCGTDYGIIEEEILKIDHEEMELSFLFVEQNMIKDVEQLITTVKVMYDAKDGNAIVNYKWTFLAKDKEAETEAKKQLILMGGDGITSLANYASNQSN